MSVIEMKMKEHAIYKICKEHDSEKYLAIVSQSSGYAKLCCYAVKKLNENEIVSSYENICVALWLMFPKYEKFHLKGFDDMPDTDYMEKIIKLRSTPTQQDYLTGGNVGFDKNIQNPWQLTRKGQVYAEEAENIFSGKVVAPEKRESAVKKTPNAFNNTFSKLWQSNLFKQFDEDQAPDSVDKLLVCAAFHMSYSPTRFVDDFNRRTKQFESDLNAFEKDISDDRIDKTRKFLVWLRQEVKKLGRF